ncbi:MAG: VCBS repeat-containing protein [Pyrinomonadaceae bacterium]|nr:VCBS repeat-containing protein [Pyrinomonadaceae bacterium]
MQTASRFFGNTLTIAILIFTVSAMNVAAATFTVTNTNDNGAGSLRQAITEANAAASDDVINFDGSFNVPRTITLGGTVLTIIGNGALTINGTGRNLLTVSGNNQSRVFEISAVATPTAANVSLNGLTIRDGFGGFGAGIGINNGNSNPNTLQATVTVNNATITNNNASVNAGGGIGCFTSGTVNVNNSIISNNAANGGGGINIGSGIGTCFLSINGSEITRNTGQGLQCCGNGGNTNLLIDIANSTFSHNTGGNGSAIRFGLNNFTTRRITNSTFFGNRDSSAIQVAGNDLFLDNVTIAGNTFNDNSARAAGLLLAGFTTRVTSRNTIIANNFNASGGNDIEVLQPEITTFTSQGYNLFENIGSTVLTGNTTGNLIGVDPLLDVTIRDNGGLPQTINLRPGSPAIDAGDPMNFSATDGRGIARPQDGDGDGAARSDIGAFEKRAIDIIPPTFDFNGDRKSDVSVVRANSTGNLDWYSLNAQNGFTVTQFGVSTDKITPADFDGDGRTDIAVFRDNTWFWLNSSNGAFNTRRFGQTNDVPVPADYTGDGRDELAVYRNGIWFTFNLVNNDFQTTQFGVATDKPVSADYDGDGRTDFAVVRRENGQSVWYVLGSTRGYTVTQFGFDTDKPVPADYDGDGKTDVAVYRSGNWHVLGSTQGYTVTQYGVATDIPVAADFDGDGRSDLAVFRPSNGNWFYRGTTAGFVVTQFGANGDVPVPLVYSR